MVVIGGFDGGQGGDIRQTLELGHLVHFSIVGDRADRARQAGLPTRLSRLLASRATPLPIERH